MRSFIIIPSTCLSGISWGSRSLQVGIQRTRLAYLSSLEGLLGCVSFCLCPKKASPGSHRKSIVHPKCRRSEDPPEAHRSEFSLIWAPDEGLQKGLLTAESLELRKSTHLPFVLLTEASSAVSLPVTNTTRVVFTSCHRVYFYRTAAPLPAAPASFCRR